MEKTTIGREIKSYYNTKRAMYSNALIALVNVTTVFFGDRMNPVRDIGATKKIGKISNGVKKIFLMSFLIMLAAGCSSLRGLMEYSAEQDEQQRYVAEQKKNAERLFKDIEENRLVTGKTSQQEVMRRYGEPVLVKEIDKKEQWLYRTATEYFPSKKAYLLFNEKGILENVEVAPQNP